MENAYKKTSKTKHITLVAILIALVGAVCGIMLSGNNNTMTASASTSNIKNIYVDNLQGSYSGATCDINIEGIFWPEFMQVWVNDTLYFTAYNEMVWGVTITYQCTVHLIDLNVEVYVDGDWVTSIFIYDSNLSAYILYLGLPTPEDKIGYTFDGWYLDEELTIAYNNEPITADMTFYAKYTAISYTITLNNDSDDDNVTSISYTIEDTVTLPTPTKTGYTFLGWFNANGEKVEEVEQGSVVNLEFTAKWIINQYTVTFIVHGEVYKNIVVDYGTVLGNYSLLNTETNSIVAVDYALSSPISEDTTITASTEFKIMTCINYVIGDNVVVNYVEYNSKLTNLMLPVVDGLDFVGWYYDEELTQKVNADDTILSATTLYASFTELTLFEYYSNIVIDFVLANLWWFIGGTVALVGVITLSIIASKKHY